MQNFFIAGTDTGIGKTYSTLALMKKFKAMGYRINGMKPIASGASWQDGQRLNEDAQLIQENSYNQPNYDLVNPYCFTLPVSPNFAAEQEQITIHIEIIEQAYLQLKKNSDLIFVEGVGGWRVPFADNLQSRDLVSRFELEVILIIGLKLGCINHALLTRDALLADGVKVKGWIANCLDDDYLMSSRTVDFLSYNLPYDLIGEIPYAAEHEIRHFNSDLFLQSV